MNDDLAICKLVEPRKADDESPSLELHQALLLWNKIF